MDYYDAKWRVGDYVDHVIHYRGSHAINDPAILSKIYDNQINSKIAKKIKNHQKKIYKSIEQTIIDRAKKNKEVLEIL